MRKALRRFRQGGGWRLLWTYARMGVLPYVLKVTVSGVIHGESYKAIYGKFRNRIAALLQEKYAGKVASLIDATAELKEEEGERKIWFCWMQGMDSAPDLVKACLNSVRRHAKDREVIVLDGTNYVEWVQLPEHVVRKYQQGMIPPAMYADLLRLALLVRYGGTWTDATVLCTADIPEEIMTSRLFIFRYIQRRTGRVTGMSNWFITSCKNNRLLSVLQEVLYQYWRDFACVADYYIFHLFFGVIAREMPEALREMPRMNSYNAILLQEKLNLAYPNAQYDSFTARVPIHKLSYRLPQSVSDNPHNIYHEILREYLTENDEIC